MHEVWLVYSDEGNLHLEKVYDENDYEKAKEHARRIGGILKQDKYRGTLLKKPYKKVLNELFSAD